MMENEAKQAENELEENRPFFRRIRSLLFPVKPTDNFIIRILKGTGFLVIGSFLLIVSLLLLAISVLFL